MFWARPGIEAIAEHGRTAPFSASSSLQGSDDGRVALRQPFPVDQCLSVARPGCGAFLASRRLPCSRRQKDMLAPVTSPHSTRLQEHIALAHLERSGGSACVVASCLLVVQAHTEAQRLALGLLLL